MSDKELIKRYYRNFRGERCEATDPSRWGNDTECKASDVDQLETENATLKKQLVEMCGYVIEGYDLEDYKAVKDKARAILKDLEV